MSDLPRFPDGAGQPQPPYSEPPRPEVPATVTGAFWAFIVSTVIGIVGALLLFGQKDELIDAARRANSGLSEEQLTQAANIALGVAVVIAIIIALLYVLFAVKLRGGRNWARIVLTVLTVLQVLSLVAGSGGTWLSYLSGLAAVIGVVLSFLGDSNTYIAASKQIRR
ncbi:hypothetical protein [Amycolatopsis sp. FDAARGOS 1241]|uniref:hypothetical protein n=1 Tax=Amycolatopsis sp. FDAARGOS 1241 TaxID=2778070 RepID=UPI00194E9FA7|nr:hypothetical protein [Amycolatopsis sp. FDAARGOS 1241]QRP49319.1 hypothetical protein I6J71_17040 [Amycolatopsis sp. FDAARGOS 1241]